MPTTRATIALPAVPIRRSTVAKRHGTGDRLSEHRRAVAHVRVRRIEQDNTVTYQLAGTLAADGVTEVQLTGRLRDLALFADTLVAALADARRAGAR